MRSTLQLSNSSMPMLGLGALVWMFTIGAGTSSAFEEPHPKLNSTTDLSGLTQNWDKRLLSSSRFTILSAFGGAAVRDDETGLVWEKTLETAELSWIDARAACVNKDVGNRKGWRLPSIPELASLVDPSISPGPMLPMGHPFTNVQSDVYWSATTNIHNPSSAWLLLLDSGKVNTGYKTITFHVWCVRGAMTNAGAY